MSQTQTVPTSPTRIMQTSTEESCRKATVTASPDMKALREAIPAHCFQPSFLKSISYVIRDLILMTCLFYAGYKMLCLPPSPMRTLLWTAYGFTQGLIFTGLWILAHECGHDSFSVHRRTNAVVGFVLHSTILVPFFSWKYSHARHHRYTNHMEKDTVFVPARKEEYRNSFLTGDFLGHAEDAPIISMTLLFVHQLLGWPVYILLNAGAGLDSLVNSDRLKSSRQSHLDPWADIFTTQEHPFVLLSNIGLAATLATLWCVAQTLGTYNVFLLYGVPYLWMNHWLVAITYLHHTHPEAPKFEAEQWTYQKGALATIDRDFGFVGKHLFHGIIEFHVVHHLFPRIPFYHAEEATEAIMPLLGEKYIRQDSSFIGDLWRTFVDCSYVEQRHGAPGEVYWAKAGKSEE